MAKVEMKCFRCDNIFWVDEEDIEKKRKCPKCGNEHNVFKRSELPDLLDTSGEDKSTTEQDDRIGGVKITPGLIICALVGIVFLVVTIITFTKTLVFLSNATKTTAVIIEIRVYNKGTNPGYAPVFTYKDSRGQTYENVPDQRQIKLPARYQVGNTIKVLYNPENPQEARIYSFGFLWLLPLVCLSVFLFACAIFVGYSLGILEGSSETDWI